MAKYFQACLGTIEHDLQVFFEKKNKKKTEDENLAKDNFAMHRKHFENLKQLQYNFLRISLE